MAIPFMRESNESKSVGSWTGGLKEGARTVSTETVVLSESQ
jgi:hypothetical protein